MVLVRSNRMGRCLGQWPFEKYTEAPSYCVWHLSLRPIDLNNLLSARASCMRSRFSHRCSEVDTNGTILCVFACDGFKFPREVVTSDIERSY